MFKHTKGPWHRNIKPARRYPTVFAGRNTHVAVMVSDGLTDEEVEANTNLVTAAPELLDGLFDARQAVSCYEQDLAARGDLPGMRLQSRRLEKIDIILAKAVR